MFTLAVKAHYYHNSHLYRVTMVTVEYDVVVISLVTAGVHKVIHK